MPIYEYVCEKCKVRWEATHVMDERKDEYCPECGGQVDNLISTPYVKIFEPFFEPNLSWRGDHITSEDQLRRLCRKKKVQHSALL